MAEGQDAASFSWFTLFRSVGRGLLALPPAVSWLLALSWAGAIWWFSDRRMDFGMDPANPVWPVISNLAHAPLFGILALFVAAIVLRTQRSAEWPKLGGVQVLSILAPVVGWAAMDEWHQSWTEGRHSTWTDVLMDTVGAVLVLWVVAYLGGEGAREAGLRKRLWIGVLTCVVCAVATTRNLG